MFMLKELVPSISEYYKCNPKCFFKVGSHMHLQNLTLLSCFISALFSLINSTFKLIWFNYER